MCLFIIQYLLSRRGERTPSLLRSLLSTHLQQLMQLLQLCILPYKAPEVPLDLDDVSTEVDMPIEAPDVLVEAGDVATSPDEDQELIVEGEGRESGDVRSNLRVDDREEYQVHLRSPQMIDEVR